MPRLAVAVVICTFAILSITGCSTVTGVIDGPPAWCTAKAKTVKVKEGDDLVKKHAEMTQEYQRERARRRCLQRYARAVSG